jgi:hypothetical protein
LPLLHEHYDEISLHKHMGYDLKPNVALYQAMQDADQLMMMIGRLEGRIVAYFVVFVRPSIHYRTAWKRPATFFTARPTAAAQ